MNQPLNRIGVFTSGGDAPGMNACIRAVVRTAISNNIQVYGILRGYQGMIDDEFKPMTSRSVSNIIQRGGTILKTARSKEFLTTVGMEKARKNLAAHKIDGLIAIGGDGTFKGAEAFCNRYPEIKVIGIPGTIDNDLTGTELTLGFDTAVNTTIEAIDKIRDTAASHDRLFFIEVMGRDSGCIALWAGLAGGAEEILLPEKETDIDQLINKLSAGASRNKSSSIVIVAEGEKNGGAVSIAKKIKDKMSHYETKVTVLGHVQRGGSPTANDRILGTRLGVAAIEALVQGRNRLMAGWKNNALHFTELCNAVKHQAPLDEELFRINTLLTI